jgi:hypothetical protein
MDANGHQASVIGSLPARHNQRGRTLRVQRRSEPFVEGTGAHDLFGVVRSRLGSVEVTAHEDVETTTPGWQVVLAPAQRTLATIAPHTRTLREVPPRATSYTQAARQCGVGNNIADLGMQDPRALDQCDDIVGRAGDGLVVVHRRQSNDAAAVAGTAADHARVLDSLQRLANRATRKTRVSAQLCFSGQAAPQGIAPTHDVADELLGQLVVRRARGHHLSVAPTVTLTRQSRGRCHVGVRDR